MAETREGEKDGAAGEADELRDIVGTAVRMFVHHILPLARQHDVRELLLAVYAAHLDAELTAIAAAFFRAALQIEPSDQDWPAIERVVAYLTDGRKLGHG